MLYPLILRNFQEISNVIVIDSYNYYNVGTPTLEGEPVTTTCITRSYIVYLLVPVATCEALQILRVVFACVPHTCLRK